MKHLGTIVLGLVTGMGVLCAEQPTNNDEAAIQRAIASYVDAFNNGDAKALAAHWTEQGEFVTPAGKRLQGREELEDDFTAYFAETRQATLELVGTTIEFTALGVAIESGIARVVVPEQEPSETEYQAVHIKTADGWKIDSLREEEAAAPSPTHYQQLQDIEWIIGEWTNADESSNIKLNCRWTTNQNFLVRSFSVFIEDRVDFAGTQVIGWDPSMQTIRSWLFDSDGGFGVGRWSGAGDRWAVHTLNILPDGRRASATNIYQLVDENTISFQSIGRQVDGELLPSIDPVTIVRAPVQVPGQPNPEASLGANYRPLQRELATRSSSLAQALRRFRNHEAWRGFLKCDQLLAICSLERFQSFHREQLVEIAEHYEKTRRYAPSQRVRALPEFEATRVALHSLLASLPQ